MLLAPEFNVIRLAVVGAGLIGRRHIEAIATVRSATLCAVAEPHEGTRAQLTTAAPVHASFDALMAAERPDGLVLATPNAAHAPQALAAIAAGIPVLIEKPITATVAEGRRVVAAAEAAGVPLLVGHHRRHNSIVVAAKAAIAAGRLGQITAAHTQFWLYKPDDYFAADWRRMPGGGPVMINLIHEVDVLRHLVGEVVEVMAMTSNAVRGHAVEDAAAVLLRFANGALGTLSASDATSAPWSWELTSGENPAYPQTNETSTTIGGTAGSLAIPANRLWCHPHERSWWAPIRGETLPADRRGDPLVRQIEHFCDVIAGRDAPLVSGRDGLAALAIVEAILESARQARPVSLPPADA